MKFSFMSFSCPKLSLDEALKTARKYGYDGFEPRAACGHNHGVEISAGVDMRKEIRRKFEESGIKLCCIATSCSYANPETSDRMVDETRQYIDLAADVGAPALRVFGGVIPEGISREKALEQVVAALRSVAGHAGKQNVKLCVETHDSWCDPADAAKVIKGVNSPSVAVNWDIMHPVLTAGCGMEQAFNILKDWIGHVHVHDGTKKAGRLELASIGRGEVDHRTAVELLNKLRYKGFVSGEWIEWESYEVHLPRELAVLKSYL